MKRKTFVLFLKRKSLLFVFVLFLCCSFLAGASYGVSSLFTTPRASKVGDTLTVIISEFSTASQTAKTSFDKSSKSDGEVSFSGGSLPSWGWDYSSGYGGSGLTQRKASLVAKLTVEVVEVLSNGNLKVKGEKRVRINQEEQVIYLEGVVRPQDIGPDNTISSTDIAQIKIRYEGKGPISEARRPGFLTRIFNLLRIF